MALYLVTGGAGFIGSNIVSELVKKGEQVRVLDNLSTGKRENLTPVIRDIEFIEGDIRDSEVVRQAVSGADYVIHQAALPSVPRSIAAPLTSNEVNVIGTLNVLLAAREHNVQRVVYASSSSAYGNTEELPKYETMPTNPMSPYAVAKLAGENYCRAFSEVYDLPTTCLRYFNVFGPRQDPFSEYSAVIPKFINQMIQGDHPVINGDGSQSRDFTFVANVVQANLFACERDQAQGQTYNVGCGRQYSLLELVKELGNILNTHIEPKFAPVRTGDVQHSFADITKIQNSLGYKVVVDFREGLRRTVEWYQSQS